MNTDQSFTAAYDSIVRTIYIYIYIYIYTHTHTHTHTHTTFKRWYRDIGVFSFFISESFLVDSKTDFSVYLVTSSYNSSKNEPEFCCSCIQIYSDFLFIFFSLSFTFTTLS